MKTNKQLIQIALDNFDKYFSLGLCNYFAKLKYNHIITIQEQIKLQTIIKKYIVNDTFINRILYNKNRIRKNSKWSLYFWKFDVKEPRKKYLEYLLKKV